MNRKNNKPTKLDTYKKKRNFSLTPEPKGSKQSKNNNSGLIFVVQKHSASHLHYDFRLEMNGVLKSWAIPKGPSLNSADKRLALQTEDHPLDYKDFEGIIPADQYGGGTVIIWDRGTYVSSKNISLKEEYIDGHLAITLNGQKLKGDFILQRIKDGEKPQWLFIKVHDKYEDKKHNITDKIRSVVSGKTLKEINPEETHD